MKQIKKIIRDGGRTAQQTVYTAYDTVSDVVEKQARWRSDFQNGSKVLKKGVMLMFMHIYGIKCDFIHRNCPKKTFKL